MIPGEAILLEVFVPPSFQSNEISAEFEGIRLPFFQSNQSEPGRYETILGVPYERNPGPASLSVQLKKTGQPPQKMDVPFLIKEGNYPSGVLKVDDRRVNPTRKKDLMRILKETKEIGEIYDRMTEKKYWKGPLIFPIQSQITSQYGKKRTYNGKLKSYHSGVDLKAALNTPVHATASGIVVLAKNLFYTGNTVIIDHGYGILTLYAHLSRLKVKKGQEVATQQLIGLSGKTGRVTGPHLHWTAIVHHIKVNPISLAPLLK